MRLRFAGYLYLLSVAAFGCGAGADGSSTPTSPSPTPPSPAPAPAATGVTLLLTGVTATTERTATGLTYESVIVVNETRREMGATISSIRMALSNGSSSGGATWTANELGTVKLNAGAALAYRLRINSTNSTNLYNQVHFVIAYTDDRGAAGTFTSPTTSITPPGATPSPAPSPAPSPTPAASFAAAITSASCREAARRNIDKLEFQFSITASGTASGDTGARLDFTSFPIYEANLNCGGWTTEVDNNALSNAASCRRTSPTQPTSISWTATIRQSFAWTSSIFVPYQETFRANLYDRNGTNRVARASTVTCSAN